MVLVVYESCGLHYSVGALYAWFASCFGCSCILHIMTPFAHGLVPWKALHGLWNIRAGVGTHTLRGNM